jgi:hypothetical protein
MKCWWYQSRVQRNVCTTQEGLKKSQISVLVYRNIPWYVYCQLAIYTDYRLTSLEINPRINVLNLNRFICKATKIICTWLVLSVKHKDGTIIKYFQHCIDLVAIWILNFNCKKISSIYFINTVHCNILDRTFIV